MFEEVKAVRFSRPVAVGPKGTASRDMHEAGPELVIYLEKGLVVLCRTVEGRAYRKGWPLSSGAVLEVDFGVEESAGFDGIVSDPPPAEQPGGAELQTSPAPKRRGRPPKAAAL